MPPRFLLLPPRCISVPPGSFYCPPGAFQGLLGPICCPPGSFHCPQVHFSALQLHFIAPGVHFAPPRVPWWPSEALEQQPGPHLVVHVAFEAQRPAQLIHLRQRLLPHALPHELPQLLLQGLRRQKHPQIDPKSPTLPRFHLRTTGGCSKNPIINPQIHPYSPFSSPPPHKKKTPFPHPKPHKTPIIFLPSPLPRTKIPHFHPKFTFPPPPN